MYSYVVLHMFRKICLTCGNSDELFDHGRGSLTAWGIIEMLPSDIADFDTHSHCAPDPIPPISQNPVGTFANISSAERHDDRKRR